RRFPEIIDQTDAANGRCRQNRAAIGLVVERHIPGNDREIERLAGLRDAANATDKLSHDLGPLGISKIQIIGDGERRGPNSSKIAPALGDSLLAALGRIGLTVTWRDVSRERKSFWPVLNAHHRRVTAWPLHGVAKNDMVILLPHPPFRAEVGRRQ